MKTLLFFVCLLFVCVVFAQRDESTRITNDYSGFSNSASGSWLRNPINDGVEGTVYLHDNWKSNAIITTFDGKRLIIKDLNLDTKNNNFVVKVSNDSVYVFNNSFIKEVMLNNKKFKEYQIKGEKRFLEVIAFNKNYEILKNYKKIIRKGKLNPLTQVKELDKYIIKETFYSKKGNSIEDFKLNKKTFSNLFGKDAKKVRDFINNNNIDVKNEKIIQTVLNFQNTL